MSKSKSNYETLGYFPQIYPNVVWCHEFMTDLVLKITKSTYLSVWYLSQPQIRVCCVPKDYAAQSVTTSLRRVPRHSGLYFM